MPKSGELVPLDNHESAYRRTADDLPLREDYEKILVYKTALPSSFRKATNILYGLHTLGRESEAAPNAEDYGYTFFTRPQLNLTKTNITNDRILNNLGNDNRNSIQRYIRMLLDPRLLSNSGGRINSDLIDNENAFIPFLSNRIVTISGFQDLALPTYTSPAGLKKVQQSRPDGTVEIYDSFSLDCTFANMAEEPFTTLIYSWLRYMGLVHEGVVDPYKDMILSRTFDFNTTIYRIVLDEKKQFVKKIAATGAAFPVNYPMGKSFDMSKNVPLHDQNKDVNIRFMCDGMIYNDPITVENFNRVVSMFSPDMRAVNKGQAHNMQLVPLDLYHTVSYRAYPRIDPMTYRFQWWTPKSTLKLK